MSKHVGSVYLLHLERPFGPEGSTQRALHYRGFARDLDARLAHHAAGTGANLLRHVKAAGIGWTLARVWENATRGRERQLKNQGGGRRQCPICREAERARRRQQPPLFALRGVDLVPTAATV